MLTLYIALRSMGDDDKGIADLDGDGDEVETGVDTGFDGDRGDCRGDNCSSGLGGNLVLACAVSLAEPRDRRSW